VALLTELTPDQRAVVALRVLGELSLEETARVLGRDVGSVKSLQHRGLARLRRRLSTDPYPRGVPARLNTRHA
jgi:RNA polymerase sigma-70 factor, ECF subfamily